MRHTIAFKGRESYVNFGVTVESVVITPPAPRKAEVTIPYRNSTIDMEDVVGYPTYDDRTITIKLWKRLGSRQAVKSCIADISKWFLETTNKEDFIDSDEGNMCYRAKCSSVDFSESNNQFMRCTVTMKADPFKTNKYTGEEVI